MSRGSSSKKFRKQRHRLFLSQNGLCHWCGMEMVWFDTFPKIVPNNACTTEHLDDKARPKQGKTKRAIETRSRM